MKCEECGKPSGKLVIVLRNGRNGFRRYKLCEKCSGVEKADKPAGAQKARKTTGGK